MVSLRKPTAAKLCANSSVTWCDARIFSKHHPSDVLKAMLQCSLKLPLWLYDSVKSLGPWSITQSESTLAQISMLLFWGRKESFHTGAASDLFMEIACWQAIILQCVDPRRRLCKQEMIIGVCAQHSLIPDSIKCFAPVSTKKSTLRTLEHALLSRC